MEADLSIMSLLSCLPGNRLLKLALCEELWGTGTSGSDPCRRMTHSLQKQVHLCIHWLHIFAQEEITFIFLLVIFQLSCFSFIIYLVGFSFSRKKYNIKQCMHVIINRLLQIYGGICQHLLCKYFQRLCYLEHQSSEVSISTSFIFLPLYIKQCS